MKIAIVNRHPEDVLGGSEMQCDNIATGLSARGHKVFFIAPAGRPGHDYGRDYDVIPVESNAASIASAVNAQSPDIVYWRFNKYHFFRAVKSIAARKIPIVFAISHISDTKKWTFRDNPRKGIKSFLKCVKQGLSNFGNHFGYRYVSGVTSLNPEFLGRLPVQKQKFVPNSVDLTSVPFSWPRPFVAWVANIKPQKQPDQYIRLAKKLSNKNVDFLMIGDIQSADYEWIKTENERSPNFHFLGPKPPSEVNGILSESLMLVHTCKPEGFGNNFLQAWFNRKPTVSLAFDPASYIKDNDLGGFSDSSWDLFVSQVERLLDDADERERAGQRAYDFASRNFSLDRTVGELEAFLTEIVATKR